jgi:hypothetical protein
MPEGDQAGSDQSRDINPVYRPSEDGTIVVYAGDLQLAIGPDVHVLPGNLELASARALSSLLMLPAATPGCSCTPGKASA